MPADIIRLYFAWVDSSTDIALSLNSFESVEPIYRTIRNTFRHLLGNLYDFAPREDSIHLEDLCPIDLWMFCQFHKLIAQVNEDYLAYRFHLATHRIHDFCGENLSKLYFEAIKDRLYCEAASSRERRSTQTVLHSVLVGLVKLLAPILPYTCEEVWTLTPGHADCASVHLSRFPKADEQFIQQKKTQDAEKTFSKWLLLRQAIGKSMDDLRKDKLLGESTEAIVSIYAEGEATSFLGERSLSELREFLVVSDVLIEPSPDGLSRLEALDGLFFNLKEFPDACIAGFLAALKGRKFLFLENSWFCRFGQKFSGECPVSLLRGRPKITNFQFTLGVTQLNQKRARSKRVVVREHARLSCAFLT